MTKSDAAFLQAMVAHHRSALEMSSKYLDQAGDGSNKDVVALAERIYTTQQAEIAKMQKWLGDSGMSSSASKHKMSM